MDFHHMPGNPRPLFPHSPSLRHHRIRFTFFGNSAWLTLPASRNTDLTLIDLTIKFYTCKCLFLLQWLVSVFSIRSQTLYELWVFKKCLLPDQLLFFDNIWIYLILIILFLALLSWINVIRTPSGILKTLESKAFKCFLEDDCVTAWLRTAKLRAMALDTEPVFGIP